MYCKNNIKGSVQVIFTYLVPLAIGTGLTSTVNDNWELGYYGHVAKLVGGAPLAIAITLSAAVSQIGMFEAEMSSDSYQVHLRKCSTLV